MFIASVPNRNSPPAILLRESYRENGKVKSRTLANLSMLPSHAIDALRQSLKGEQLVALSQESLQIIDSPQHGQVRAVLDTMKRLRIAELIHARACPERDLVMAMIAARVIDPHTKLATVRWWHSTTLPSLMGVSDCDEDDLYAGLDWLLERQERIEQKLAKRHLENDAMALYDLTSSYVEGVKCPLAKRGYNRDGKKGKLQINYGLLTDAQGRPIAVSVFDGNVGDTKTLMTQVDKLRGKFSLDQFVLVGDRGMITQTQVDELKKLEGVDWITALRPEPIRKLLEEGTIQMDLFDEHQLFSFIHPDFPGERLIACRNPPLAERRAAKRQSMLNSTLTELDKVRAMVGRGRLRSKESIGVRVGKVVNKFKMSKHFTLEFKDDHFDFSIDQDSVTREAALDGIYVIRSSVNEQRMDDADTVRNYKSLSQVERAFRMFKSLELQVRPIHHRLEARVRAHIFLCMLAYYVQWHMLDAWRPLLFSDEDQQAKTTRDPVAPATRSSAALEKVHTHTLEDGSQAHSYRTLMKSLGSITRNTCCIKSAAQTSTFEVFTTPNAKQQHAFDLLKNITV
jgi:hypothetical protein